MSWNFLDNAEVFSAGTKAAFLQYLRDNPNSRRVSESEKEALVNWLTKPGAQPSSQKDFSRRNYVRRTFTWDSNTGSLLAIAKKGGQTHRHVIIEDMILETVEMAHRDNGHAGWDATWKDISNSYYGILRSDVIFLLKQCRVCASNPRKRPKDSAPTTIHPRLVDYDRQRSPNIENLLQERSIFDVLGDMEPSEDFFEKKE